MTQTQPPIRFTSRNDVLALPSAMLGFTPHESLVMVHMLGKHVEFCSRVDLDALRLDPGALADQMVAANSSRPDGHWLLLLYTGMPLAHTLAVEEFALLTGRVSGIFATDGLTSWEVLDGELLDGEPYDPSVSLVAAEAVWRGKSIAPSRDEMVAVLGVWDPCPDAVQGAREVVWRLGPDERLELLRTLVEGQTPVGSDLTVVGALLGEEECFAEMMAQLCTAIAPARVELFLAVRQVAPVEALANVTALLTIACWLAGEGALTTECLIELETMQPGHPIARMVQTMQQLAIPPSRWDEG